MRVAAQRKMPGCVVNPGCPSDTREARYAECPRRLALPQPDFDRRRSVLREETHNAFDLPSGGSCPALRGLGADHHAVAAADLQPGRRAGHHARAGALGDARNTADRRAEHPAGADRALRRRHGGVVRRLDAEFVAARRRAAQRQLGNRPAARRQPHAAAAQPVALVVAAFVGFLAMAGVGAAQAQPAPSPTILHLSETATVPSHPDELAATIRAEVVAPTPADAQQRGNKMVADALARAHQVPGVTVSTGNYSGWRVGPTPQDHTVRWPAGQTIALHGRDGAPLLKLVGELQQKGLALNQLGWRLSDDATRAARQQALAEAL